MHVFRAAFAAKDARKQINQRSEDGERVIANRRSSLRSIISEQTLRREVSIDLECLMNTTKLGSMMDLSGHESARKSIINFGLPDIVNRSIDESRVDNIEDEIRDALLTYEPRLDESTIKVKRDKRVTAEELKVSFFVSADLYCDPVNIPVEFVADVLMDTAKIVVNRL